MIKIVIYITLLFSLLFGQGCSNVPGERWSEDKALKWFESQEWPCGFNYIPATAVSYTEMWMPYCFITEIIDKELELAEYVGFNCLRVVLPFVVWEHNPEDFKDRLSQFLEVCDKRNLKVMFALFDDCAFGSDSALINPWYGKQPDVVEGWYASGWTPSPGHGIVKDSTQWYRLEKYVKDIISEFKNDHRVWVWDLYNEPTNMGTGEATIPLVDKIFKWSREINPVQPLTVDVFTGERLNKIILSNSDIITFHNYNNSERLLKKIKEFKQYKRPVICTEWLNRPRGSIVATCLPVFYNEGVGCMLWGLVNGKTQTHLHWGWRPGMGTPEVWQHDIYKGDHSPYDQKEITVFKKYIEKSKKK